MFSPFYTHIVLIVSCIIFSFSLFSFIKRFQAPGYLHELTEISTDYVYKHRIPISNIRDAKLRQNLTNETDDKYLREKILGSNKTFSSILYRFKFLNPSKTICNYPNDTKYFLIIIVLSRALNFDYRQAIRATWGHKRKSKTYNTYVQTIFFVGTDDTVQTAIRDEQAMFNDVVEVGIPENYPFVAHKELASLLWTRMYCPLARVVFRADDDILLDTFLLLNHIKNHINLDLNDGLYGWFRFNNSVHRVDRWAITKLEYASRIYPPYTFGIGYLLSNVSCQRLIDAANDPNHHIIRIGDAYITGILRELAGIPFYEFNNLEFAYTFYNEIPCDKYFEQNPRLLICMSKLHIGYRNDPYEFYDIWDIIMKRNNTSILRT